MFKKFFYLLFVVLLVVNVSAQEVDKFDRSGGYARVEALGSNPFIVDPTNLTVNPAYAALYTNFLWGDIGSAAAAANDGVGQFAGLNFKLNKEITLGAILSRSDFNMNSISQLDPGGLVAGFNANVPGAGIIPLDNNFEILGSLNAGNMTFGLGIAYAASSMESKPAVGSGPKNSASQIGVNAGLLGKLTPDATLDVGVSLVLPSVSYTPAGGSEAKASQTFIAVDARVFYKMTSKMSIVPLVSFMTVSGKYEVAGTSTDIPSVMNLGVGFGINYKAGDLLIAGGPSLVMQSQTTPAVANASPELKDSKLIFPNWNLGAEWQFTDWLIGRLGYSAHTESITNQSVASATTKDEMTFTGFKKGDVTVGVGLRFGNFALDATVNDDIIRQGLNNIGGGTPTLAYVSASYGF